MDLTVIIPTHNRSELLKQTLQGFCEQDAGQTQWELIIVSDGSTDSTCQTVKSFESRLPVRFFTQPKSGTSTARNLGLREARAPIVLFLDDDVIPAPRLIREHLQFHAEQTATEAVLLGYVTWYPELPITPFMRWYGEFGGLFAFSRLRDNQESDPRYLYTCNISFKTDFLRRNGGFNPLLSVLEDYELGYRLQACGMKMVFWRDALGYHNQTFTFDQACKRLERYRPGLTAFLQTDAGKELEKRRTSLLFRMAETAVKILAPALSPLRPLLDSKTRLPNVIYRIFYWYHGLYRAYWSRARAAQL